MFFRQKNKRTYLSFGRFSYEAYVLVSGLFLLWLLSIGYWLLFCCSEQHCKDIALFCIYKIKTELFSLICNIFLYSLAFVLYGVCERHPEEKNTTSPCRKFFHAMRLEGCKDFCWWPPSQASFSAKTPQILHFDIPSSKCCVARHNPQAGLVFCTHSFAFLMMFHHRRNSRLVFLK